MKIKHSMKILTLSIALSTLFVGCGGGDTASAAVSVLTGTFVDAPTQGLGYKTASQSGFTDANGKFKYQAGEEVEFTLGNLSLGKGPAGTLMTPYTVSDNNDTATNIALLLQNFDANRTNTGGIDLSFLQDANLSDVNLSATPTDMETLIGNLFNDARFSAKYSGSVLLNATTVKSTMDTYLASNSIQYDKKFTEAYLAGHDFYTTDDLGPLIMRFNNDAQLYYAGDSYLDGSGTLVVGAGYDGNFTIDGSGVAAYTLDNGIITIGYGGGSVMVSTTATEITDDYIKVSQTDGTTTKTATWYLTKAAAINSIKYDKKFTQVYLDTKIFYAVYENGEKNTLVFQNNQISLGELLAVATPLPTPHDYSITSVGTIVGKYGNAYATIGEITNQVTAIAILNQTSG